MTKQYTPGIYWIEAGEELTVGLCTNVVSPSKTVHETWELLASDEIVLGFGPDFYIVGKIERPEILSFRKSDLKEPNFFWIRDLEDGTEMVVGSFKATNAFGEEKVVWVFPGSTDEYTTEEIEADFEVLGLAVPPET